MGKLIDKAKQELQENFEENQKNIIKRCLENIEKAEGEIKIQEKKIETLNERITQVEECKNVHELQELRGFYDERY